MDGGDGAEFGQGCGPVLSAAPDAGVPLRQQVFERIRAMGRAGRADVARALGVSAGTLTPITAQMIEAGLLVEVEGGARSSARGRPPVALAVEGGAHLVAGLRLGDDHHDAVLSDFAGRVLAEAARPARPGRTSCEALAEDAAALTRALCAAGGIAPAALSCVGVGVPGMVDGAAGRVHWSPLLSERTVDLAGAIAARLGVPVEIENDAHLVTLAELWFGAGRAMSDFLVVTVERGIGMGAVVGNRLFRGGRGSGLEIGHVKVVADGALCRCGKRGCLEAYVADFALEREGATLGGHATLDTLYDAAEAGDPAACAIFQRAARYLALGLSNVVQLFDPELVVLSGARMRYVPLYGAEMQAEMHALTLSADRAPPRVEIHRWDGPVWARGASALALSAVTARCFAT
ncbi:MAG: ROK family protein [Paracoccaceae bacterium]